MPDTATITLQVNLTFSDPVPARDVSAIVESIETLIEHGMSEGAISPDEAAYGCEGFSVKAIHPLTVDRTVSGRYASFAEREAAIVADELRQPPILLTVEQDYHRVFSAEELNRLLCAVLNVAAAPEMDDILSRAHTLCELLTKMDPAIEYVITRIKDGAIKEEAPR